MHMSFTLICTRFPHLPRWISSLYTDAKPLQWRVARMLLFATYFFFFAVSLPFYSTCVSSTAENENGDANVETGCSCYVAVTPVCSLCRIMTADRSTASINPTSLACRSAATTNCIKQYLSERDTIKREFFFVCFFWAVWSTGYDTHCTLHI